MRRHSPGRAFFGVDARTQVLMRSAVRCPCASTMAAVMVVSISSFCGRVPRSLEWTDQGPRDGCASIAFPQRLGRLFSPAAKRRHSSRDKKAVCRRPPRCFGPDGCGPIAPRAKDRHRGCDWRGPTTEEDHHGYHRHLHRGGQRLRRIGQDAHAQLQGLVSELMLLCELTLGATESGTPGAASATASLSRMPANFVRVPPPASPIIGGCSPGRISFLYLTSPV